MIPAPPEPDDAVLVVGLTGGIASGKSTVSGMFRELGATVIDADALVHQFLEPGGVAVGLVLRTFGAQFRRRDGGIDRRALADLIFNDEDQRRRLETLMHPMVLEESKARIAAAAAEGALVVFYDAALLVETRRHEDFHRLVVVSVPPEIQLKRLIERDNLSPDEAGARLRSQLPLSQKALLADYLIDNSCHWGRTRNQVSQVWQFLLEDAGLLKKGQPLPIRRVIPG